MSAPPGMKLTSLTEPEARPVLVPAGNKARSVELRKPISKLKSARMQDAEETKGKKSPAAAEMVLEKVPSPVWKSLNRVATILRQRQQNLSLNASCSSDASSDSSHSRASTGRIGGGIITSPSKRKQQCGAKGDRIDHKEGNVRTVASVINGMLIEAIDGAVAKKRCAWVTSNADLPGVCFLKLPLRHVMSPNAYATATLIPCSHGLSFLEEPLYAAFHDEEWGFSVHDDKKLFELLSFSTALAELTWPAILSKRHIFRDVFLEFDPIAVSTLSEKKIATAGSLASSLLSELKLRSIIENARQIRKIIDEFGSFDKYIWGFVNYKPIVGNFRYSRQVPIKTSKADTISNDLVRRGLRGVGPTVIYSFMQAAGITNDHLVSCFRYQECITLEDLRDKYDDIRSKNDQKLPEDVMELALVRDIDDLSFST